MRTGDDIRAARVAPSPLPSRRSSDLDPPPESADPARPEPSHANEVADRPVRPAHLALLDDPARADGADAREPLELGGVRGVEVDAVAGRLRRRHHRLRPRGNGLRRTPEATRAVEPADRQDPQDRRAEQDEERAPGRWIAQPAAD